MGLGLPTNLFTSGMSRTSLLKLLDFSKLVGEEDEESESESLVGIMSLPFLEIGSTCSTSRGNIQLNFYFFVN